MFVYKRIKDQVLEERQKNSDLLCKLDKAVADLEYVAMMTDVELEEDNNGQV